jgi:hypothetical protein
MARDRSIRVEPRRGTERRLAPIARAASARGTLALAAAALLLAAGCGGDSEGPEAASAPNPAAEQGAGATGPSGASAPASKQDAAPKPTDQAAGSKSSPGTGAKRGAALPLPRGDGRERGPTPAEEAQATVADMTLTSPALSASGTALPALPALPARYTCDGKDTWPALQWGGTPPGCEGKCSTSRATSACWRSATRARRAVVRRRRSRKLDCSSD